jgi:Uma2 family endonuclease
MGRGYHHMTSQLRIQPGQERQPPVAYVNGVPLLYEGDQPLRPLEWYGTVPLLYEEEEGNRGEPNPHLLTRLILFSCLRAYSIDLPQYHVFSNLSLYYQPHDLPASKANPNVEPDTMVVEPYKRLDESIDSYTIGEDGPAPKVTIEALSQRTFRQRDLDEKTKVYAFMGVAEYILVDVTGAFLHEKLLLKRLQPDGTYIDERDSDGGVTSKLGFRLVIEQDGQLRVVNAATGKLYLRPLEAAAKIREAEAKTRNLEAEIARLQEILAKQETSESDCQ